MNIQQGCIFFFFFNDTATTEIYTLSLHDALPILNILYQLFIIVMVYVGGIKQNLFVWSLADFGLGIMTVDRKSTRLNSSHANISYAVFCLKKKKRFERSVRTPSSPTRLNPLVS